jgi:anti-sigma factor RsiW
MHPDRQILSVYLDGELPSPWKEEMEAHLARCPECRAKLEQYRTLSAMLVGSRQDFSVEKERVWLRLGEAVARRRRNPAVRTFWRQSVAIPLPAAIAAAAIFVASLTLAIANYGAGRAAPPAAALATAGISLDAQEIVPVSDMNSFLQYLEDEDSTDFMIIRLPETRSFSRFGQPSIIKASGYSGSGSNQ